MQLSIRLETLSTLAGTGERAADVGTDHGMVPIELVRRGAFHRAIASDVRKGPLAAAGAHVRAAGLADQIELRLGDGLKVLTPGEADVILISGMGGALMQRILTEGKVAAKSARRLVLSPQSEIPEFRSFLQNSGYAIIAEKAVFEDGKFYILMTVESGEQEPWEGTERLYGKILLDSGGEVTEAYVRKRKAILQRILRSLKKAEDPKAEERRIKTEDELKLTEEALLRLTETV